MLSNFLIKPPSTSLLLQENNDDCCSKILTASTSVNPLVQAVSPLLLSSSVLSEETVLESVSIYQNLIHEIKAFQQVAKRQGYHSEEILIANYLLCEFLDDKTANWSTPMPSLLFFFHQEKSDGEKFFLISEKLSHDPSLYIDLLTLIYLFLSLGYAGKYRKIPNQKAITEKIADNIFSLIRLEKTNLKKDLHITPTENTEKPKIATHQPPVLLIFIFSLILILTVYNLFSYLSGNHAQWLYQQIGHFELM